MRPPGATRTPRDVAEAFVAVSQELLQAVQDGNVPAAVDCVSRRARLIGELAAIGRPDIVTETLVATGQRAGEEALVLAAARSEELRRELDAVGLGRTGLKAYGPAHGARDNVWDVAG